METLLNAKNVSPQKPMQIIRIGFQADNNELEKFQNDFVKSEASSTNNQLFSDSEISKSINENKDADEKTVIANQNSSLASSILVNGKRYYRKFIICMKYYTYIIIEIVKIKFQQLS